MAAAAHASGAGSKSTMVPCTAARQVRHKAISGLPITSPNYFKLLLEDALTQPNSRLVVESGWRVMSIWNQNLVETVVERCWKCWKCWQREWICVVVGQDSYLGHRTSQRVLDGPEINHGVISGAGMQGHHKVDYRLTTVELQRP